MKRIFYVFLFLLAGVCTYAQQAKYVFFFIGDGMGGESGEYDRNVSGGRSGAYRS